MKLIICIDKNNGVLFGGRRQSQDAVLRAKIFEIIGDKKLYMSSYSAEQFENNPNIIVTDGYLSYAGEDDYCFAESEITSIDTFKEILVFNWNRNYPFDVSFDFDLKSDGFKKISSENFKGNSHDKITLTIYGR